MRIPRIYTSSALANKESVELDPIASNHVGKVLRMQPNQSIILFNGDGSDYSANLSVVSKKQVTVTVSEVLVTRTESPLYTHIGQVMSRGDRMDYMIQKSTELGVSEITPLYSERCEVKLKGDREDKRIKHWQHIAISAAEQCGRSTVPRINGIAQVGSWIKSKTDDELGLVMHHRTTQKLTELEKPSRIKLLIGPEGGLSEPEINTALDTGFKGTTLGPRVFRTETAPIATLSILQWLWGDFT